MHFSSHKINIIQKHHTAFHLREGPLRVVFSASNFAKKINLYQKETFWSFCAFLSSVRMKTSLMYTHARRGAKKYAQRSSQIGMRDARHSAAFGMDDLAWRHLLRLTSEFHVYIYLYRQHLRTMMCVRQSTSPISTTIAKAIITIFKSIFQTAPNYEFNFNRLSLHCTPYAHLDHTTDN